MPGPTRAFNEVKALLNKLDRSIDEARSKLLAPEDEPEAKPETASPEQVRPASQTNGSNVIVGATPNPAPQPAKPSGPYGRARPLRPNPSNQADWR